MPFQSKVLSLADMFDLNNKQFGLVIPEYQRSYLWTETQFKQLVINLLENFSKLDSIPDKSCFLGSIIFCKSLYPDNETIIPQDIVDGQQRLTTLFIFLTLLYLEIDRLHNRSLDNQNVPSSFKNLISQEIKIVKRNLKNFLLCQELNNNPVPSYMPRIIRQNDTRSISLNNQRYSSTISKIAEAFKNSLDSDTNFVLPEESFEANLETTTVSDAWAYFRTIVNNLHNAELHTIFPEGTSFAYKFVPFESFLNPEYSNLFYTNEIDLSALDENNKRIFSRLIRTILFTNFVLKKCLFSLITCDDPNDAYDIFDTLNTSGIPLTALETLKPQVVLHYQQNPHVDFFASNAFIEFTKIEALFDQVYPDQKNKDTESKKIMVALALYTEGKQISENVSDQRYYVRDIQNKSNNEHRPDEIIKSVNHIAQYRAYFFKRIDIEIPQLFETLPAEKISLIQLLSDLFSETKTHLVVPPLTRVYEYSKNTNETQFKSFINFMKALASFFVIRRSITGTTGGIDTCFRLLMNEDNELNFSGLKTNFEYETDVDDLNIIKRVLIKNLANNVLYNFDLSQKEAWVNHVSQQPLYRYNRFILRFLLHAAYHDSMVDPDIPGLITRENAAPAISRKFLNYNTWKYKIYSTLEHVAPNNTGFTENWPGVYEIPNLKHTIGNFVLLPSVQNINLSNRNWNVKKLFYNALSTQDQNQRQTLLRQAAESGLNLSPNRISELAFEADESEVLKGFSEIHEWDSSFIQLRSKRILELAWDQLVKWLEPEES